MKLKEVKPKYEQLKIYFDKENFSMLEIPHIMKYDFALTMYADRKVLMIEDFDEEKFTEIVLENEQQFKRRQQFEK